VKLTGRGWWSRRTAVLLAVGALAGLAGWALGPRATLALAVGAGAAGALVVVDWLRARIRWLSAETARLRTSQVELRATLDERIPALERKLSADLAAVERRLRSSRSANLSSVERRLRADLTAVEHRLRTSGSGDLAALEKRLRGPSSTSASTEAG